METSISQLINKKIIDRTIDDTHWNCCDDLRRRVVCLARIPLSVFEGPYWVAKRAFLNDTLFLPKNTEPKPLSSHIWSVLKTFVTFVIAFPLSLIKTIQYAAGFFYPDVALKRPPWENDLPRGWSEDNGNVTNEDDERDYPILPDTTSEDGDISDNGEPRSSQQRRNSEAGSTSNIDLSNPLVSDDAEVDILISPEDQKRKKGSDDVQTYEDAMNQVTKDWDAGAAPAVTGKL